MSNEINVSATKRETSGTSAARRLRRTGVLPAVLCDLEGTSTPIQLDEHTFEQMLGKHAGESLLINLTVDGQPPRKVLLREVQHDPVRDAVQHADFVEVSLTRKLHITVPIELVGDPVGVEQQGGILEQLLREVTIECLPSDIIEELKLDVTGLNLGESLHVGDLPVADTATILDESDIAVATVAATRAEDEGVEAVAEEETEEPEVISGRKEREEQEEEEGKGKE